MARDNALHNSLDGKRKSRRAVLDDPRVGRMRRKDGGRQEESGTPDAVTVLLDDVRHVNDMSHRQ
jgi:hypothetical protein